MYKEETRCENCSSNISVQDRAKFGCIYCGNTSGPFGWYTRKMVKIQPDPIIKWFGIATTILFLIFIVGIGLGEPP